MPRLSDEARAAVEDEQLGHGVKVIVTELAHPRSCGDGPGGYMTSMERAIEKGLVALEDGRFVLTERGWKTYDAMGRPPQWWKRPGYPKEAERSGNAPTI